MLLALEIGRTSNYCPFFAQQYMGAAHSDPMLIVTVQIGWLIRVYPRTAPSAI